MRTPRQPGVYVQRAHSGVRMITGVATSITVFVGWAPRGRTDQPVRLGRFADYERSHGGLDSRSLLGYAVRAFFDNGGSDAYVLRIVGSDADTAKCSLDGLHVEASSPGAWGCRRGTGCTSACRPMPRSARPSRASTSRVRPCLRTSMRSGRCARHGRPSPNST